MSQNNETPQVAADSDADVVITKVDGEWNIRLRNAARASANAREPVVRGATVRLQDDDDDDSTEAEQRTKWFKEMRGWLMVLATVAASASYQAGLNPPGGFWQEDDRSHRAGDPALHDEHRSRYLIFYYLNATAFVTSLVIMVLLMSERFYHTETKVLALLFTTVVDLASLIGAYIAGTTRYFTSCIYVIVITCVAFVAAICIGELMVDICAIIMMVFPCVKTLGKKNWCPIPNAAVEKANKMKAQRDQRRDKMKNNGTCCSCFGADEAAA